MTTAILLVSHLCNKCKVELTTDNQVQSGYGRHVTYTHYLENRGNCEEPVRAVVGFLADSLAGWVSAAYIDNPVAGGASIPGVLDKTDTPVTAGWTALLAPGQGLRILVDVLAPVDPAAAAAAAKAAKALVAANVTTLTIDSTSGGSLKVTDRTTIDDTNSAIVPEGVLRNFTDGDLPRGPPPGAFSAAPPGCAPMRSPATPTRPWPSRAPSSSRARAASARYPRRRT